MKCSQVTLPPPGVFQESIENHLDIRFGHTLNSEKRIDFEFSLKKEAFGALALRNICSVAQDI